MSAIDKLLGLDQTDPVHKLASDLVNADQALVEDLVAARREAGMTQKDVAKALGIEQSSVANIERLGNDPRLSTLRRYALAVRARVSHEVRPATECGSRLPDVKHESSRLESVLAAHIAKSSARAHHAPSKRVFLSGIGVEAFGEVDDRDVWRTVV